MRLAYGVCRCQMRRANGSKHDYTATYQAPAPLSAVVRKEIEDDGLQTALKWAQREDEVPLTALSWTWTEVDEPDAPLLTP